MHGKIIAQTMQAAKARLRKPGFFKQSDTLDPEIVGAYGQRRNLSWVRFMQDTVDFSDIEKAANAIAGQAIRTPLLRSDVLDQKLDAQIFLKPECLQRTGSFKFRGAFNAIENLGEVNSQEGILACSSGNHAQGVAEAARIKGLRARIVMPSDAPQAKKDRTRRSGAQIIDYDRHNEDREAIVEALSKDTGAPVIHPYDNRYVIAGQGTAGLEMAQDMNALGVTPDRVLVCTGGGGLTSGVLLALKHYFPAVDVHPVEPQGYDDQSRSLRAGKRLGGNVKTPSVCDALLTPMPGKIAFEICKDSLSDGLVVSDEEALRAVAFAFREFKLVVEPGGAVALAALLSGKVDVSGQSVLVVLSGGNIDADIMARALAL